MSSYILSFLYIVIAKSGSSTVMYNLQQKIIIVRVQNKLINFLPLGQNTSCKYSG